MQNHGCNGFSQVDSGGMTFFRVRLYDRFCTFVRINPAFAEEDLNCLLPLQRLLEMEASGEIGCSTPSHYSIMGYILQPEAFLTESTPAIIQHLQNEVVDVVILVPT